MNPWDWIRIRVLGGDSRIMYSGSNPTELKSYSFILPDVYRPYHSDTSSAFGARSLPLHSPSRALPLIDRDGSAAHMSRRRPPSPLEEMVVAKTPSRWSDALTTILLSSTFLAAAPFRWRRPNSFGIAATSLISSFCNCWNNIFQFRIRFYLTRVIIHGYIIYLHHPVTYYFFLGACRNWNTFCLLSWIVHLKHLMNVQNC